MRGLPQSCILPGILLLREFVCMRRLCESIYLDSSSCCKADFLAAKMHPRRGSRKRGLFPDGQSVHVRF